jgi:hypothetical protein
MAGGYGAASRPRRLAGYRSEIRTERRMFLKTFS